VSRPSQSTPEADLAYLRSIVESAPSGQLTTGVVYLAGGLLYGLQCLFHIGQVTGVIRWPDLANLVFVIGVTVAFMAILTWVVLEDRRRPAPGPLATRAMNAAFSGAGAANSAIIIVFAVGANRDQDFGVWLYYPAMIFAAQAGAWLVAWTLKRKAWMALAGIGGWIAAVALGLLVRQPVVYLYVCTVAVFVLFAGPGWIMVRDARRAAARA
jgi:hypothetical protein